MAALVTFETPGVVWIIEGKIESLPGGYGGDGAHVGIDELSDLLAKHVDRWAKIRVELIEGPRPLPYVSRSGKLIDYEPLPSAVNARVPAGTGGNCITEGCKAVATLGWHCAEHHAAFIEEHRSPGSKVDADLKRIRELTKRVRLILELLRALPVETADGSRRYGYAPEEGLLESMAETMLVVCDQIEGFERRLQSLESRGAK